VTLSAAARQDGAVHWRQLSVFSNAKVIPVSAVYWITLCLCYIWRTSQSTADCRVPVLTESVRNWGRAVAQAVSCRPLAPEARARSQVRPCGICGGQSGTVTGFSPSTLDFPRQFHSTGAPLHGKTKKLTIFIAGLCNNLQGCGASVASAMGPFTTKKNFKINEASYVDN
jgi:hypothetical protein